MTLSRRSMLRGLAAGATTYGVGACALNPSAAIELSTARDQAVLGAGGWCWFQEPRACIDEHDQLWVGSTQGRTGPTPGAVEVRRVDLAHLSVEEVHVLAVDRPDDHTSPSVLPTAAGLQVGWAPHRQVDWFEVGTLGAAGTDLQRVAAAGALAPPARGTAYVSAHIVDGERWVLTRGRRFSWSLFTSPDGRSWTDRGLVVQPAPAGQRPYLLAASDGERLHLVVTSGNPTEYRGTSATHGTLEPNGTVLDSCGRPVGRVGDRPPAPSALTELVVGAAGRTEADDVDAWLSDLRIVGGRPTAVLLVRRPWRRGEPAVGGWNHEYRWAELGAGGRWRIEHLGWAGSELYRRQPDYAGLGVLDPDARGRVVVSTNVHPGSAAPLLSAADGRVHWELFEGRRQADRRWHWTPLTSDSAVDHLRPVLVQRASAALLWMRGTYRSWMDFDTSIVLARR